MEALKNKPVLFTLLFIVLSCFVLSVCFTWKTEDGKPSTKIIDGDGKGLYMYLPAIFITQDLDMQTPDGRFIFETEGGGLNKYFAGTAISMMPFFGIGYAKASIHEDAPDGYSAPFHKAISIAALFYLCIGLIFMSRLLMLYGIKNPVICITLLLTVFGTNLLVYTVYQPAFSHVYSFAFISIFLFYTKKFIAAQNRKHLLLLAFALGMITIIRPTNACVIFMVPFLAGSFSVLKETFSSFFKLKNGVPATIIFIAIVSIQLYLWYVQTGNPFMWSYQGEGFYFFDPQIFNVLFSFRKGFFIYTPLALVMLGGLVFIYRKSRFQFYSLLLFLFLIIYFTASWWCWYYGPSFGQRTFVEFSPVFALLLAFLLNEINYKKTVIGLAVLLSAFNLVQSYQYAKNILSSWNMDLEKYKYVFLKTSPEYYGCLGGCDDIEPYSESQTLLYDLKNDYEKGYPEWNTTVVKMIGSNTVSNFSGREFNSDAEFTGSTMAAHRLLYAKVTVDYMQTEITGKEGPVMGILLSDEYNKPYYNYTFQMNGIPNNTPNEWKTGTYTIEIPKMRSAGDHFKIYVWNQYVHDFYIDNFHVKLYGID